MYAIGLPRHDIYGVRRIMPECDCGTTIDAKNSAGHYRDQCAACIRDAATTTRHVDTCDRDDCMVCRDYRRDSETTL